MIAIVVSGEGVSGQWNMINTDGKRFVAAFRICWSLEKVSLPSIVKSLSGIAVACVAVWCLQRLANAIVQREASLYHLRESPSSIHRTNGSFKTSQHKLTKNVFRDFVCWFKISGTEICTFDNQNWRSKRFFLRWRSNQQVLGCTCGHEVRVRVVRTY